MTRLQLQGIKEIVDKYGLTVSAFRPFSGGAANSSYWLQTGQGNYVLTIFNEKTQGYVARLGQLLLQLAEWEFPTTRLLLPTESGLVTMYRDKPVMLKTFIPGEVNTAWNESLLHQVGGALASLHQVPAPDFLPNTHPYGRQTFATVIGQNIHPLYESWLAEQHAYLAQHFPQQLPQALIHGDLFYDNVLIEGQTLRAIIDFEEACHYYRLFDLGMAIVGLCMEGATVALNKAQALVHGYQQEQRLEAREKEALQLFVEYAAIATSYWRFWKYYVHSPQSEKADKPLAMMRLTKTIRAIPKATFLTAIFK